MLFYAWSATAAVMSNALSSSSRYTPETVFGRWASLVLRKRKLTVAVYAAFTALCLAVASTLTVDSDLLSLMPEEHPAIQALQRRGMKLRALTPASAFFVTPNAKDDEHSLRDLLQALTRGPKPRKRRRGAG